MSGMMSLTGQPGGEPTRYGVPIGDFTAGMWCALAVTAAVAQRHVTGAGQRVETSLLGALVGLLSVQGQRYLSNGDVPGQAGNDHPTIYPYGIFEAQDGPLNVATAREEHWQRLCAVMDLEELLDDPDYASNDTRMRNKDALRGILNARFRTRNAIDWTKDLMEGGVPSGPVYSLDKVFNDPQVTDQGIEYLLCRAGEAFTGPAGAGAAVAPQHLPGARIQHSQAQAHGRFAIQTILVLPLLNAAADEVVKALALGPLQRLLVALLLLPQVVFSNGFSPKMLEESS
mgnify:CR=1 FL=1